MPRSSAASDTSKRGPVLFISRLRLDPSESVISQQNLTVSSIGIHLVRPSSRSVIASSIHQRLKVGVAVSVFCECANSQ